MNLEAAVLITALVLFVCPHSAVAEKLSDSAIDARFRAELAELGFPDGEPPELNQQFGTYEHYVVVDKIVYLTSNAGQRPDGTWVKGKVPTDIDEKKAAVASGLSCVRAINRLRHAAGGDLAKVRKIANIRFMTASPATFTGHSALANICSDMMIRVFGSDIGKHSRTVIGVTSFPHDMTHKIDVVAYLK